MTVHVDLELEQAILGTVLLTGRWVARMIADGLRAEHFYLPQHEQAWTALVGLHERNTKIDVFTLRDELERLGVDAPVDVVAKVDGVVIPEGYDHSHGRRLKQLHEWRQRTAAIDRLKRAVSTRDEQMWTGTIADLEQPTATAGSSLTAEKWGDHLLARLAGQSSDTAIPLPFDELTDALDGGLRPGEVMLVAGYTSHGKSVLADQILDSASAAGKRCHLYMTEMTAHARGLRLLARRVDVSFRLLRSGFLPPDQAEKVKAELDKLPYGCTVCADWTVDQVCADIRRAKWDLCVIDLVHGFPYSDERELSAISNRIMRAAKASTVDGSGTAIVVTAHLNESQTRERQSPTRPRPGLQSIKGAGSLKQDADIVCFVWRQDDEHGIPTDDGAIWFAKSREGPSAAVAVSLNPRRMRFELERAAA